MQDRTAQDAVFLRRVESRDMHADIRAVRLCDLPDRVVICQYIHARHILIVGYFNRMIKFAFQNCPSKFQDLFRVFLKLILNPNRRIVPPI